MSSKRRKQNNEQSTPSAAGPAKAKTPSPGAARSRPPQSRVRVWLFRILAAVAAPAIFLCLLEISLWLFDYGSSTAFFIKINRGNAYTTNQAFGWQYFPPAIAREPVVCEFPVAKAEGTCRIFIVGESAANGTPEPAFAFSRMLEVMLRQRYAGVRFEVINAAMTAINSHALVPVVRQCVAQNADVLIVYMGNNEVIGPYGPGTVMGRYSPNRWMIGASMFVKSWRTGQLLQNVLQPNDAQGRISPQWRGMEAFVGREVTFDDPRLEAVYDRFQSNLTSICDMARRVGAEVLVCTVATNLKDCAPLAAVHRAELDAAQRNQCNALLQSGQELAAQGLHDRAITELEHLLGIDNGYADAHFCLAQSLLKKGDLEKARRHYCLARDLDALRFRADSRINQAIRNVVAKPTAGVWLVDFEKVLEEQERSRGSMPGNEYFYEHVHFRPEGNYLLAVSLFRQLTAVLPEWVRGRAIGRDDPISFELCCQRLALTPWDRLQMEEEMAQMVGRAPFTQQLDHRQQQAQRMAEIRRLRSKNANSVALNAAAQTYRAAIQSSPDDLELRQRFAVLLLQRRDYQGAAEQWRYLLGRFPNVAKWHVNLGAALDSGGDPSNALQQFQEAVSINPFLRATACYYSGNALLRQGKMSEAELQYRQALELNPYLAKCRNALGTALFNQGKMVEAEEAFHSALQADSSLTSARRNLAALLEKEGKFPDALTECQQALDTDPCDLKTYDQIVRVFRKMKDPKRAIDAYRRAVENLPDNVEAHLSLGNLLEQDNQLPEATEAYRAALRLSPDDLMAGHNLGAILEKTGHVAEAIEQYRRVLRSHPDSAPTKSNLTRLLRLKE